MAPTTKKAKQQTVPTQHTTGLLDYLKKVLPRRALQELYMEPERGPFVCRAVLQQLSGTAQQVVMRLHCTGGNFPKVGCESWLLASEGTAVLEELLSWALIQKPTGDTIALTLPFAKGLKESICSLDASPWTPLTQNQLESLAADSPSKLKARSPVTLEQLEVYTQEQWDAVLHFLVGTVGRKEPPPAMVSFLLQTGLMQTDPEYKGANKDNAPLVITESGYDFMLQDSHQQVWHFVVQYLQTLAQHDLDNDADIRKEALLLLVALSFAKIGQPYPSSSVSKKCRTMIKDFSHFGLLYTRKYGKSTVFFPTRIATQLGGSSSSSTVFSLSTKALEMSLSAPNPQNSSHLAIIVQTNFQLCAYTTSELHVSMLGLFCDLGTIRRLPNVVFMHITRDSVKSAFHLGIKARQILRFLEKHAHPRLRNQGDNGEPPIPDNVVDQIWLWDREMTRIRFTKVYKHECVLGTEEYQAVVEHAKETGAYKWSSQRNQHVLLDYSYVDAMEKFVRKWRAERYQNQHS